VRCDEELLNLYSSPNIITMIKLRRIEWAEHAARIRERRIHTGFSGKAGRKETTRKT
jgi:hypothetical protein